MVICYSCSTSTRLPWILLILLTLIQAHGLSPPGFLSIDCGLTNSSAYNDNATGLLYVPDGVYVEGGLNYQISAEFVEGASDEQEKTLRSFPHGQRNCYTLPSNRGKKYLLRATFTYGNYDGLNKSQDGSPFLFALHIGVNFWTTVNLTNWNPSSTIWKEVLTVAPDDFVSVCLINFGWGTPFVSALVLRPLEDTMYPFVNTSVSVSYFSRQRFGPVDGGYITRYPHDAFDRFWETFGRYSYPWVNMSTSEQLNSLPGKDDFKVPSAIVQKASTVNGSFSWLNISVAAGGYLDGRSLELLPIFHFAELDNGGPNRRFDIYSDGEKMFGNYSPPQHRVDSTYHSGQFLRNPRTRFTLRKAPGSALPPLINAFEVHSLVRMDNFTTASDDVNYMKEVKKHYNLARINWNGDPCSPREYSWEGLTCDYTNQNPRITQVLAGNPLCSKVRDRYCANKRNTTHILLIAVIVPVVLVSLLVVLCILWKLCWKGKSGDDHEDYAIYEEETPLYIDIRRFTYAELKLITNNFQSIIGKGGFGTVYHGILENGDEVAVKVLVETSIAESKDFLPEVQVLSKVHHKNLVTLEGYCQNQKCLALVYDFMPRGDLQQLLRGGHDYSLNWEGRLRIALDAAQGLEYLHESCIPSIVHRDVKTANILLDQNLVAKISDFGLSRAFNAAHTHISTVAAGTLGYLDPEYHATFQLTIKTDVYSFGIVLLEIITGQPPVFTDPQTVHVSTWVRQKIANGSIHDVVDKILSDQYDATSLQSVVDLAMNCLENAAIDRPTMTEVVSRLKVCLPAVSSEKQPVSPSPRQKNVMDADIPRQFQLMISGASTISNEGSFFQSGMISGASTISNEGSSFQSGYAGGRSEISHLPGR